jgi:hypothetical protein
MLLPMIFIVFACDATKSLRCPAKRYFMNDQNALTLYVGGEAKAVALGVSGKLFVFTPTQQNFLINLQKLKNVTAAALSVNKDEDWGDKFLKSQKFRKYLSLKMKSFSDKNSLDVEWWYQFGKNLTEGFKEFYQASCPGCKYEFEMNLYEAESQRNDDMQLEAECPACTYKPISLLLKQDAFTPSREQVEGWKELGNRLIPKIERVHHQFENVNIEFASETEEERHG